MGDADEPAFKPTCMACFQPLLKQRGEGGEGVEGVVYQCGHYVCVACQSASPSTARATTSPTRAMARWRSSTSSCAASPSMAPAVPGNEPLDVG